MILGYIGAALIGLSLGLMGSGGSILTVPVLVYLFHQDEKVAIAGSLFIVGTIALAGGLTYLKDKLVDWKTVFLFGIPGMIGTYGGAWLAKFVPGIVQLVFFALVMLLAAYFMITSPQLDPSQAKDRKVWKIVLDGLIVGIITGLVGVGGGFLIVPALVLLGGLPMHRAIATSLIIIALKSFSGFYKYLDVLQSQNLSLDWKTLGIVTVIGILGTFAGNFMAGKTPQDKLKQYFAWFLVVMALFILYQEAPKALAMI